MTAHQLVVIAGRQSFTEGQLSCTSSFHFVNLSNECSANLLSVCSIQFFSDEVVVLTATWLQKYFILKNYRANFKEYLVLFTLAQFKYISLLYTVQYRDEQ